MDKLIALAVFVALVVAGVFCGVAVREHARTLEYDLSHLSAETLEDETLTLPIQKPNMVQASDTYTFEVHLEEGIHGWPATTLTDTEMITLSFHSDPRLVHIEPPTSITIPISPTAPQQPVYVFHFTVRGDVTLPDSLPLTITLNTEQKEFFNSEISIPIYHDKDFEKQESWRLLLFSFSALVLLMILIILIAGAFSQFGLAGGLVVLGVILAIGTQLYPPLKEILDTITPWLSVFSP